MNTNHSANRREYAEAYRLCRLMAPHSDNDIVFVKRLHHVKRLINLQFSWVGLMAYESYRQWELAPDPFRGEETPLQRKLMKYRVRRERRELFKNSACLQAWIPQIRDILNDYDGKDIA